ncbi:MULTISPECIES: HAMP domain-containing sensor histidine kinase [unclassified Arsukibacterium]|uniref:HAMP domain-containing sensor histidine kinase n=1 Tax=unclassified Arsukibacterium TaxID=2635278 RepID=UPI000C647ACA|nr:MULTISPECIES: ATP-binding protein [unclassified Arsukibacterium]MAA95862.1 HAMP domain-containing histidine kinase [Rheinheimera sp.]MBM34621.1 HAMP domain-containing histidine kinase [Rheinheimera sp.]HAW94344.1 HAMP domain-containing histidine kinase [Candidatus Azambacteria bacterium]|tara:strand:- start:530901 stop:532610 length:1710 start_codon:yes stop_codon:yes gene_type:complete
MKAVVNTSSKTSTIRNVLFVGVMTICSLTICVSMLVSTLQDIRQQRQALIQELQSYASIIAFNAQASFIAAEQRIMQSEAEFADERENIYNDFAHTEENRLGSFAAVPMLHNIHIYRVQNTTGKLALYSIYNTRGIGPYPAQYDNVAAFLKPELSDNYIELSREIRVGDTLAGYVFIRASQQELQTYIQNSILIDLLIILCALIVAYFLTKKLEQRFTSSINQLIQLVQRIAKDKDYHLRVAQSDVTEFNMFGKALNTMLDKVERQMFKQQQTETEIRELYQKLEQKVSERTDALKSSNQELLNTLATLHQYQNQIVETEKMASLGQMVAGVAHEVNTPIGLGVTASTLLQDRLTQIERAFTDKKLTSSQLEKFLSESKENLGIIYRNLERAASLISSFKQVAVDQSNDSQRSFNMAQLINEVLLSLRPNLKKHHHQVVVDCPAELIIESKAGPINQILINLIMNSLIHAFDNTDQGEITISVKISGTRCKLYYRDNGSGVPENIKKRIFDPFVTTKRGEGGSGLGLHLVYNLVTQALNGTINFDSTLGQGVQILIDFPVIDNSYKNKK